MPELPEVETIRTDLQKTIIGLAIKAIQINVPKIIKEPKSQEFKREVIGKSFKEVIRRGKFLIITLFSGKDLVIHLKLTGQLIYGDKNPQSRLNLLLSNGKFLNFNDQRLLGEIRLVPDWKRQTGIFKLGPEPLEKDFTIEVFQRLLEKKKAKIKPLLMDQTFIVGVGNIYSQESLFRAGIHPLRSADSLRAEEIEKLFFALQNVLREAIRYRGSSVDAYLDIEGKKGKFEAHLQVYGREGEPCLKCKTNIKSMKLRGRGTCFCPRCQMKPEPSPLCNTSRAKEA